MSLKDEITENAEREEQHLVKSCSNCRHVEVCFLYRMAAQGINSFNQQADGIMEFPMKPEAIALRCPKYESPLDVLKKSEIEA